MPHLKVATTGDTRHLASGKLPSHHSGALQTSTEPDIFVAPFTATNASENFTAADTLQVSIMASDAARSETSYPTLPSLPDDAIDVGRPGVVDFSRADTGRNGADTKRDTFTVTFSKAIDASALTFNGLAHKHNQAVIDRANELLMNRNVDRRAGLMAKCPEYTRQPYMPSNR